MKTRIIHTKFYEDSYILSLSPKQKFLYLFYITNQNVGLTGIYEIARFMTKTLTGLTDTEIEEYNAKFEADGKMRFIGDWVKVINADKYQSFTGSSNETAISKELALIPKAVLDSLDRVSTPSSESVQTVPTVLIISNNKYKKEIGVKGEEKTLALHRTPDYLLNIPLEDIPSLSKDLQVTVKDVQRKGESLHNWYLQNPKRNFKHDWRATLRNALIKDFPSLVEGGKDAKNYAGF